MYKRILSDPKIVYNHLQFSTVAKSNGAIWFLSHDYLKEDKMYRGTLKAELDENVVSKFQSTINSISKIDKRLFDFLNDIELINSFFGKSFKNLIEVSDSQRANSSIKVFIECGQFYFLVDLPMSIKILDRIFYKLNSVTIRVDLNHQEIVLEAYDSHDVNDFSFPEIREISMKDEELKFIEKLNEMSVDMISNNIIICRNFNNSVYQDFRSETYYVY